MTTREPWCDSREEPEPMCVCGHAQRDHRPFGGRVAYAECSLCACNHCVVSRTSQSQKEPS